MDFFYELFQYRFLTHATLACLLCGLACGMVGTYVVCRRLVFLSGGITHSSFGGIGIAYYFGLNPIAGAFCCRRSGSKPLRPANGSARIRRSA